MRKSFITKLCCPFDKGELELKVIAEDGEEIREGILTCRECDRYYPIVHGIPIMSPDEYRERSLEEPLLRKWALLPAESAAPFRISAGNE